MPSGPFFKWIVTCKTNLLYDGIVIISTGHSGSVGRCPSGDQRSNLGVVDHNDRIYYMAMVINSYLSLLGRPRKQRWAPRTMWFSTSESRIQPDFIKRWFQVDTKWKVELMVKPLYNDSGVIKSQQRASSNSSNILTQVMLTPAGKNQHDARECNVKKKTKHYAPHPYNIANL